jgi:hypothetical protein
MCKNHLRLFRPAMVSIQIVAKAVAVDKEKAMFEV